MVEDELGSGSTQATVDEANNGKDQPFWDALNAYVPNLHAVISGHGEFSCARQLTLLSSRFMEIMGTSGASASRRRTSYSALPSTLGTCGYV